MMNGGIFEPGGIPSGLLVQDGKEWRPLNRKEGEGNFHLKPNGVFLIGTKGAAVIRTEEYPPQGIVVRHAVQSGPLLPRHGKVHPAFRPQSASRLHRNGVGVTTKGEVVFAMSDFHSPFSKSGSIRCGRHGRRSYGRAFTSSRKPARCGPGCRFS